ncbi:hypothetical protein KC345_g158 [Hortaea werneckii]|nr:hypothetical protein KC345_g158 [Hortaea werneckii]
MGLFRKRSRAAVRLRRLELTLEAASGSDSLGRRPSTQAVARGARPLRLIRRWRSRRDRETGMFGFLPFQTSKLSRRYGAIHHGSHDIRCTVDSAETTLTSISTTQTTPPNKPSPNNNYLPTNLTTTTTMTDSMPMPTARAQLPRNDSFSTHDIHQAFKASASKPRNNLSLRVVQQDETAPPPPSPLDSRPASAFGFGPPHRRDRVHFCDCAVHFCFPGLSDGERGRRCGLFGLFNNYGEEGGLAFDMGIVCKLRKHDGITGLYLRLPGSKRSIRFDIASTLFNRERGLTYIKKSYLIIIATLCNIHLLILPSSLSLPLDCITNRDSLLQSFEIDAQDGVFSDGGHTTAPRYQHHRPSSARYTADIAAVLASALYLSGTAAADSAPYPLDTAAVAAWAPYPLTVAAALRPY